ncbi:MAG: aldo/keto reductase [Bowdeniella nasicola]|nr:aldo/keto reductase [Bowdeniella nasicola]
MEIRNVGHTGLRVSATGLGTMTWGSDTDIHDADAILADFLSAGGTLIDTAPGYGQGRAEEVLGQLLTSRYSRRDVVIMTKAGVAQSGDTATLDTSRRNLLNSLDDSLATLGVDHVDIFMVQGIDQHTPLPEIAAALTTAVRSARAHYVGIANATAWQVAYVAGILPTDVPLAVVQAEYSLVHRQAERDILPAASALGLGFFGCAPLGRGVLTGKYRHTIPADSRAASAHLSAYVQPYLHEDYAGVIEAVATAGEGLEVTPAQIAHAWALNQTTAVITGPRTPGQARAVMNESLTLPPQITQALATASMRHC